MSAGFGWSPSDVVLLIRITRKVVKALDDESGAKSQYRKVVRPLVDLETILHEIHAILKTADPVFCNALRGQLDLSTSSIRDFCNRLEKKYGNILDEEAHSSITSQFRAKIHWAVSAAEEISQFHTDLSRQLDNVKFIMTIYFWFGNPYPPYKLAVSLLTESKEDNDRVKRDSRRQSCPCP